MTVKSFFRYEPGFRKQIRKLLAPIVIQNLLSAAVSSTDVIMLNYEIGRASCRERV